MEESKKYSNGEITVVWKPGNCIHSTICWKQTTGLPEVFNPREKPWISLKTTVSEKIEEQVKKCPSGALSYYFNKRHNDVITQLETRVEALPGGPLLVYGNIVVKHPGNQEVKKSNVTAFCRCGQSQNKPFCDGSHVKHHFEIQKSV